MLISIIIPVYNAVHTLNRAINSVLGQTYKQLEMIIIDGSSTDGTLDIINQNENEITSWISENDQGIYDAMNKGVSLARGDWIYFLGADDILVNCLHKVEKFLNNEHNVYYGDVYLPKKNKVYGGKFTAKKLAGQNINHQAIFYPRRVFDKYSFDLKYRTLADYALNIACWGDNEFRFIYIPILIAIHSDTGLSSISTDEIFERDKPLLVQKHISRQLARGEKFLSMKKKASNLINSLRIVGKKVG